MKRKLILIFFFCITCTPFMNSQINDSEDYKTCLKQFYDKLLKSDSITVYEMQKIYLIESYELEIRSLNSANVLDLLKNKSLIFEKLKTKENILTQGCSLSSIYKAIDKSEVFNEGFDFTNILELKFKNGKNCFFEVNTDLPKKIQNIWLPTGGNLTCILMGHKKIEKFLRPGIINDPDGFTNIRAEPKENSMVVTKIAKNILFFYSPNYFSNWWSVYSDSNGYGKPIGYIHNSRIKPYKDFPKEIKTKVNRIRSGS